jgi:uncharacterized membrane protein
MMSLDLFLSALALVACLACGLVAGVFFAFSAFVMKALARIAPSEGIAAMQSINVVVLNVWFLSLFLGTAAICVVALVVSLLRWSESGMAWMLAGGLLYLAGTVLVTIACNVPRNEALAKVAPSEPAAANFWARYVAGWTAWNHVRTAAALAAAACFGAVLAR